MKYSKTKKQKFSIFAIVYSLVIMLAVLQFGGIIFNTGVLAIDEWNTTVKPTTGISIIENSSSKTTMLVSTPAAFDYALYYASNPTSTVDLTIELVNSIDMSAKYIKPRDITNSKLTKLTMIGHGNTISGLKYSTAVGGNIGLISLIKRPLLVEGVNFRLFSHTISTKCTSFGALIGTSSNDDIIITKCSVYGTIIVTNCSYIGGLIGISFLLPLKSLNNCWSYCTITSSMKDGYIGGLVGFLDCKSVFNCANFEGTIKSTSNATVGGLFGSASVDTFSKCFNQAKVESNSGYVGGIIGKWIGSSVNIDDCYNNADLSCGDEGEFVGGLVGYASSSLTFNRCYHNGELKRAKVDVELKEDTNYTNKEIASYKVTGDQSYYESHWDYDCNVNFCIQNGGGDDSPPINTIHVGISKIEKIDKTSIVYSNLCGNSATYNNSFCRNTYDFGYDSTYGIPIMQIQSKFTYNSNTSHVLEKLTIRSGILNNSEYLSNPKLTSIKYLINDINKVHSNNGPKTFEYRSLAVYGYTLVYGGDNQFLLDLCPINMEERDGYRRRVFCCQGFSYTLNDDSTKLTIYPVIEVEMRENPVSYSAAAFCDTTHYVTIDLPSVSVTNNTSLISDTSDIKLETLGTAFTTASGRNGDLPILKDFYWEYAV